VAALTIRERQIVLDTIVERLREAPLLAASVSGAHAHLLVRVGEADASACLGQLKRVAARRVVRSDGRLWGRGAGIDRIRDVAHQRAVYAYILAHEREGALVWRFRE
jgi:hypothetical protein